MAFLQRQQVKEIVEKALKAIAGFNGDIENYEFSSMNDFQKKVFLDKLVQFLHQAPYHDIYGKPDPTKYYDAPLSLSLLNTWQTMKDCIDYVLNNHTVKDKN